METIRVMLFGKSAFYLGDKKIIFPFAKMEAMLYYLLVMGEASREKLATLFWGDMDDNAAKKNLRNTIYLLKKTISPDLFSTASRLSLSLNGKLVQASDLTLLRTTDVKEFLVSAKGDFLEGFYCRDAALFNEWVVEQRERFREEIRTRLTKDIVQLINAKDYTCAKQHLKYLIELDEYNESAYRALMKIYEKEGATYKVIDAYHDLERKMARDLGLNPGAKTQEIYKRVREREIFKINTNKNAKESWFFGRKKEIKQLQSFLDTLYVARKHKPLVIIEGEQGVGKSALVECFIEGVPTAELSIVKTQCYQDELSYSYKAWSTVFIEVMGIIKEAGISLPPLWLQVLACVFPNTEAGEVSCLPDMSVNGYHFSSTMTEEVLCGILGKAATYRRLVLVLEDIHWMDSQGLSLLRQFLRLYGEHCLVLATCRSEVFHQVERFLWDFEKESLVAYIHLERFTFEEVIKLSDSRLAANKISYELQQKLYDYTGGNALFLIECLNLLESGQDISHGSLRLQSVLKERMSSVSDTAKKILEIASVFFDHVNYEELLAVSGSNEFELVEVIEELEQKRLITETMSIGRQGPVYKFYNLQIRDYVYGKMSVTRRRMYHQKAGLYLEKQLGQGLQVKDVYQSICYHYERADDKLKVLEYTIKLAEKYFCPQYEMFPELNDYYPSGQADFRECRQQITHYLSSIDQLLIELENKKIISQALILYKAAYWEMQGRYLIWRGEHFKGTKIIHKLLTLAKEHNLEDYRLKGYQQIIYCGIQIRRPKLIALFAEKLRHQGEHSKEKQATALRFLGLSQALSGHQAEAEEYYRQSISLFKKLAVRNSSYVLNIAAAYNYIGDLRRASLDVRDALSHYEQAVRLVGRKGISEGVVLFYINTGYTAFELGDYGKARQYLMEALLIGEGFGDQRGYWCLRSYCTLHCVLSLIAVRENRLQEGRLYLEKADEFLARYHDSYQKGLVLKTQTEIRLLMDRRPNVKEMFGDYLILSAETYYQQAKDIFDKLGITFELRSLAATMSGLVPSLVDDREN